jgi:hypothetical protein
MAIFGELETFATEQLYPYRWPILIGLAAAAVGFALLAVRLRWHAYAWRHRVASAALLLPLLAVALPAGWYTLSPLFERTRLDEASPLAAAAATADELADPAAPDAAIVEFMAGVRRAGQFSGADEFHFGRGEAQLIETAPGVWTLRFGEFSVRNGPDLFVYLARDPEDIDGALNLGGLKATDGAFNYDVPTDIDPTTYSHAVVWCRQFAVLFASAPLAPA